MYRKPYLCQIKNLPEIYMKAFGYRNDGYFVEIGAFDGWQWSNTSCLVEAGWSGIFIEPHPLYFSQLQERYKDNPKIKVENICIGNDNGIVRFYLGGSLSTIKPEMVDLYNSIDWAKFSGLDKDKFIERDILTLNTLLDGYQSSVNFEVLVIDVEGAEIDVLKGFTIDKWTPQLVIVETHKRNENKQLAEKSQWIDDYFIKYGYRELQSDYINSIYVIR